MPAAISLTSNRGRVTVVALCALLLAALAPARAQHQPQIAGTSLPISQIAIELYRPLDGGISLGGRFAPESLKVPHMLTVRR